MAHADGNRGNTERETVGALIERLRHENEALGAAHLAACDQLAKLVLTGVAHWTDRAGNPRDPQHLMYRALLQRWADVMNRVGAGSAGVVLPGG